MKVLEINSVCGIRSTGRIAAEIAEKFMAEGHTCRIAYGRETVPEKYRPIAVRIGSDAQVYRNGALSRLLDNEGFGARSATRKFLRWAEEYDPDLLWLHNLHGYYFNVEELFGWIKSRPRMAVRWTLHDCWAFTGHCAYFTAVGCEKWRTGCDRCPQKGEYPASLLSDCSRKNYERKKSAFTGVRDMTLITPSHWLAGLVKESFLGQYPVEVIHNTIDETVFRPTPGDFRARHGLEGRKLVLGVASVWERRKGLDDLLQLAGMLGEPYTVVLVGVDEKQLRALPAGVVGIRRTNSPRELAEIYTTADVFVNPTYEDNYPTVNLEARACGTPVITYRTGGSVESVEPENIVEVGDVEGLQRRILEICR